jgi:alpha-1,2-glucosyltransferase
LLSYLKSIVLPSNDCGTRSLRVTNFIALLGTSLALCSALKTLHSSSSTGSKRQWAHTAANICLFPPLFFFSALYYTDVPSVFFVLLSFIKYCDSRVQGFESRVGRPAVWQVLFGLVSLWFRQTNIFWVGVFPAGLALVEVAKGSGGANGQIYQGEATFAQVIERSWDKGALYDPPVEAAYIEG